MKEHIIMLKKKYKRIGAVQIRTLEGLSMAPKTMRKIWKESGIPSRKRPKNMSPKIIFVKSKNNLNSLRE